MNVVRLWPNGSYLLYQEEDGTSNIDKSRLQNANWCVLVAINDDTASIVGYLLGCDWDRYLKTSFQTAKMDLSQGGRVAKLEEVLVLPEHQKKGVGTLLVRKFEEWARLAGCKRVQLGGGPAPDFYKTIGYNRVGPFFTYLKEL